MLLHRVLTAIVLLVLVVLALYFTSGTPFRLIALVLPLAASWEWGSLFGYSRGQKIAYTLASAALGAAAVYLPADAPAWGVVLVLASLFWLLIAPLWLVKHWKAGKPVAALLGWLLLFAAWKGLLIWHEGVRGAWLLTSVMLVVWIADTAAYFTGKAFGRHKLAPAVSPGKTWEGALGALIAVTAYLVLLPAVFDTNLMLPLFGQDPGRASFGAQILSIFLTALLLTAVSIVGDLLESLFKRQAGLKDSGKLLPGHGGFLDRIDSLIAVLALAGAARWAFGA